MNSTKYQKRNGTQFHKKHLVYVRVQVMEVVEESRGQKLTGVSLSIKSVISQTWSSRPTALHIFLISMFRHTYFKWMDLHLPSAGLKQLTPLFESSVLEQVHIENIQGCWPSGPQLGNTESNDWDILMLIKCLIMILQYDSKITFCCLCCCIVVSSVATQALATLDTTDQIR